LSRSYAPAAKSLAPSTLASTAKPSARSNGVGIRRLRVEVVLGSAAASLFGLWTSLRYCLATWAIDPDIGDTAMLWSGMHAHGLGFLKSWYYTQDNWLLSLAPFHFVQFALFGTKPLLLVISGWVIFVGCVAVALVIAWRMAGLTACLVLAPVLLLCRAGVVGKVAFLSYPIEHNISLLWGLVALVAAARWIRAGSLCALAGTTAALSIDGISDPWAKAAFLVPMLISGAALAMLMPRSPGKSRLLALCAAVIAAGIVCQTKFFGWLSFLPEDQLLPANWQQMNDNFVAFVGMVAAMFSPFPGIATHWPIVIGATWLLLGPLTAAALGMIVRRRDRMLLEQWFLLLAMLLSVGGVTGAFLIGTFQELAVSGRFFMNLYVFLPIVIATGVALAGRRARPFRLCAGGMAALLIVSGIASQPAAWLRAVPPLDKYGVFPLAAFLQSQGLRHGYGAYWGTDANAVSWVSHDRVEIRPVKFDPDTGEIAPRPGQTSPLWYEPNETMQANFVIVTHDPENCPKIEACVQGVINQFGSPVRTLTYQDMQVLVWNHGLPLPPPPR
jgi:hypothetical protein